MSHSGSTTRTVGSLGSSTDSGGGSFSSNHRKDVRNNQRRFIRILTVVAYMMSVSAVALVLSAYYLFIWKPSPSDPMYLKRGPSPTDIPQTTAYRRQTPPLYSYTPMGKMRRALGVPTPQSLVQKPELKETVVDQTVSAEWEESKSTSTPQRAPASAPQIDGGPIKTTPHLLKLLAPTLSPAEAPT